jgi:general secretion pathway protein K
VTANPPRSRPARRGYVLVAVLWLVTLIASVLLALSTAARRERAAAINAINELTLAAALEAGVERAKASLAHRRVSAIGALDADSFAIGHTRVRTQYSDPEAKLNLNLADSAALRRFLQATGIEPPRAAALAGAICDWRDADDQAWTGGGERSEYIHLELALTPENRLAHDVSEFRNAAGITESVWRAIGHHVTVLGTGRVNINSAPREVLASLPGFNDEVTALAVALRAQARPVTSLADVSSGISFASRRLLTDALPALASLVAFAQSAHEVEVTVTTADGAVARRTVELLPSPGGWVVR